MAAKTWNGGGADNNWSTGGNWGGTAPTAGDTVTFNGTSTKNCTVDNIATFNGSITVAAGYTGVITQGSNVTGVGAFSIAAGTWSVVTFTFNLSASAFSCTGGTFNGGSGSMTTGSVTFNTTGTLTATSGTWTLKGNWTQNGAGTTFSANGGTIAITTACTFNDTHSTFSLVTVNAPLASVVVSASTTMPLGASPTVSSGIFTVNGKITGSGTLTLTSGSTPPITLISVGTSGTISGISTIVGTDGGLNFAAGSTIPAGLNLSFTATRADFPSNTLEFLGGGNSYGTVIYQGVGPMALYLVGNATIAMLQCNAAQGPKTIQIDHTATITITASAIAGSAGNLVSMLSDGPNTPPNLSSVNVQNVSFCVIKDMTASSAAWVAGQGCLDAGGNSNIVFTANPRARVVSPRQAIVRTAGGGF